MSSCNNRFVTKMKWTERAMLQMVSSGGDESLTLCRGRIVQTRSVSGRRDQSEIPLTGTTAAAIWCALSLCVCVSVKNGIDRVTNNSTKVEPTGITSTMAAFVSNEYVMDFASGAQWLCAHCLPLHRARWQWHCSIPLRLRCAAVFLGWLSFHLIGDARDSVHTFLSDTLHEFICSNERNDKIELNYPSQVPEK